MECAGRAKRRRRFGCCEALAQLKAPSPLRSAGALQMVVLRRSAPARGRVVLAIGTDHPDWHISWLDICGNVPECDN